MCGRMTLQHLLSIIPFYIYWLFCIIIFQLLPKKLSTNHFRRATIWVFAITLILTILSLLAWKEINNSPRIKIFIMFFSLLIVLSASAVVLFMWHALRRGGVLLFALPFLFLMGGSKKAEQFFDKYFKLSGEIITRRCFILIMVFVLIPSFIGLIVILLPYLKLTLISPQ